MRTRTKSLPATIVTIVIVVLVLAMTFFSSFSVTVGDNSITAKELFVKVEVPFSDVQSVEMIETIVPGTREFGTATTNVLTGKFKNDVYGSYHLYVFKSVEKYIVVKYGDGKTLVTNQDSAEKTVALYEEIKSKTSK